MKKVEKCKILLVLSTCATGNASHLLCKQVCYFCPKQWGDPIYSYSTETGLAVVKDTITSHSKIDSSSCLENCHNSSISGNPALRLSK